MATLSDARLEPMFRDRSLNRADIATDLAIPLLAEHGWAGLTLAGVAARGSLLDACSATAVLRGSDELRR